VRLSKDPVFACVIMVPTDRELAWGTSDIHLGGIPEDSFQGFPLRAARVVRRRRDPRLVASDLAACGFNTALLVGFCGSNFTPGDLRSPRFLALTRALKTQGFAVGVCIPFADTVDNQLTRADPRMHQRRWDGKEPFVRFDPDLERPPCPIFIIDFGCAPFVQFARELIDAACDAGMDFIDFAEPDYWPTEENGHGLYLEAAWRAATGLPLPHPGTLRHRLFMEDYHLAAMKEISAHAHRRGLQDHLTASPLGHLPYHVCQNYGKYASTSITELSSTYHYLYGLGWKERLSRSYGIDCTEHRVSSLGCMEVRSMRRWEERHATYLVPGQSLPATTYANALDQQMFLHNMDVIFWEYPSIRRNYYESTDPWAPPGKAWLALRRLFSQKSRAYLSLPPAFHSAVPAPEALVFYSKRGVYVRPSTDEATPCAYAASLRLMKGGIQPLFLYAEDLAPLETRGYSPRILLVDEHNPVPPGGWKRIAAWLARGSRVVIYGGSPGREWASGSPRSAFDAEFSTLFGVRAGSPRGRAREDLCPVTFPLPPGIRGRAFVPGPRTTIIARAGGRALVSSRSLPEGSRAVYVALPLCELPTTSLAVFCAWLLSESGGRSVTVESPLDIEHCLYRSPGATWLSVKNHSVESRTTRFTVAAGFRPTSVRELLRGEPLRLAARSRGSVTFEDMPGPNSVSIYEIAR
jgi:hypothetical protein